MFPLQHNVCSPFGETRSTGIESCSGDIMQLHHSNLRKTVVTGKFTIYRTTSVLRRRNAGTCKTRLAPDSTSY